MKAAYGDKVIYTINKIHRLRYKLINKSTSPNVVMCFVMLLTWTQQAQC